MYTILLYTCKIVFVLHLNRKNRKNRKTVRPWRHHLTAFLALPRVTGPRRRPRTASTQPALRPPNRRNRRRSTRQRPVGRLPTDRTMRLRRKRRPTRALRARPITCDPRRRQSRRQFSKRPTKCIPTAMACLARQAVAETGSTATVDKFLQPTARKNKTLNRTQGLVKIRVTKKRCCCRYRGFQVGVVWWGKTGPSLLSDKAAIPVARPATPRPAAISPMFPKAPPPMPPPAIPPPCVG